MAAVIILAMIWGYQWLSARWSGPTEAPSPPEEGVPPADGPPQPPAPVPAESPAVVPGVPPAAPPAAGPALVAVGASPDDVPAPVVIGSARFADNPFDLEAEVVAPGGAMKRLTLARATGYYKTVADRYHEDPDERRPMDLVEPGAPFSGLLVPRLDVWLAKTGAAEGDPPAASSVDLSEAPWRLERISDSVAVTEVDVRTEAGKVLTVRKTYMLSRAFEGSAPAGPRTAAYDFVLRLDLLVPASAEPSADPSVRAVKAMYVLRGPPALPREDVRSDLRQAVVSVRRGPKVEVERHGGAIDPPKGAPAGTPAVKGLAGPEMLWVGQEDKYFAVVLVPLAAEGREGFAAGAEAFRYEVPEGEKPKPLAGVQVLSREVPLAAGAAASAEVLVFAGPKDPDLLARLGRDDRYRGLGLEDLIIWSRPCCWGMMLPGVVTISKIMVLVLEWFHVLVRNYGIAIILLVIVLRVVLHPVTRWSTRSMARMQRLSPKIQALRDEHGDDKERLNREMMELYRKEGINPVGGCLPMFLQMPIWIGLYGALQAAISLRHAAFIPVGWLPAGAVFLQDLSQPDGLVTWTEPFFLPGRDVPLLGWLIGGIQNMLGGGITSFNILPILMAVTMHLQQRLTPQTATGPQAEQQKKMMVFMTIFLLLVLYNAPAGLCLYIFTSSLLGFAEQRYLKKMYVEQPAGGPAQPQPKEPTPPERSPYLEGKSRSFGERARRRLAALWRALRDRAGRYFKKAPSGDTGAGRKPDIGPSNGDLAVAARGPTAPPKGPAAPQEPRPFPDTLSARIAPEPPKKHEGGRGKRHKGRGKRRR